MYIYYCSTLIGQIGIQEEQGQITRVYLPGQTHLDFNDPNLSAEQKQTPLIKEAFKQLNEYFCRKSFDFNIPICLKGTFFQMKVWDEIKKIPYGSTAAYKDIAMRIGNPNAARAVGQACNKNPIPLFVPCHRVVGANGDMTGFSAGLGIKVRLLEIERE